MKPKPEQLAAKYIKQIKFALKQFGEYTYYDKGAREVMEIPTKELMELSTKDVAETLYIVSKSKHTNMFLQEVVCSLQSWDRYYDLLHNHSWLNEYT